MKSISNKQIVNEETVQKLLVKWFKINGYVVIERCIENPILFNNISQCTTHNVFGIDIVAKKDNLWIIEVKGDSTAGVVGATANFRSGIGQILTRMHKISTDIHYALAVPNTDNYIPAVRKIIDSKALPILNLSIILVEPDGTPIFL